MKTLKKIKKVVFTLDGKYVKIKCTTEDKLKDIYQKYSTQINKNMNTLSFLYQENKINFELSFKDHANFIDRNNHEMKILVYKIENYLYKCPKCDEKISLNTEKLDEIISSNDKIKEIINGSKLQIDNIIKTYSLNSLNIQLNNINKMLNMVIKDINKNNQTIKKLLNGYINTNKNIDNNITNITVSEPIKIDSNSGNAKILENENLLGKIKSILN